MMMMTTMMKMRDEQVSKVPAIKAKNEMDAYRFGWENGIL